MKMKNVLLGLTTTAVLLAMQPVAGTSESHAQEMDGAKHKAEWTSSVNGYTLNWNTPSANASGAMPIGNGDLYKLGRVRVALYPSVKGDNVKFIQKLNLAEGKIEFKIRDGRNLVTGWHRNGKWVEKPKSQRNDGRKIYICNPE
jgi:hypothetical protein